MIKDLIKAKFIPRGRGKSIQYHLCILGAERFLPDIYLHKTSKKRRYTTIYERHETYAIKWAARKGFVKSLKKIDINDPERDKKLRVLIESFKAAMKILEYH